jgi:serine/threonine-protein kinase HipA
MGKKMRNAWVFVDGRLAGELQEIERGKHYRFEYLPTYKGSSVSLTMPTSQLVYVYDRFPPFFEGLLPEGDMLGGLLRYAKIDRDDLMTQLITVGQDMVGNVTVYRNKSRRTGTS